MESEPNPNRVALPPSGYIPSSVYTRSQYRTQHFPTLSTGPALAASNAASRSHSVPADEARRPQHPQHPQHPPCTPPSGAGPNALTTTPTGLYNIPHQRTSLVCQSLDDLGPPSSTTPPSSQAPPTASPHPHTPHRHHRPDTGPDRCA